MDNIIEITIDKEIEITVLKQRISNLKFEIHHNELKIKKAQIELQELEDKLTELEYGKSSVIKISKCDSCSNNTQELSAECYDCVKGIEDNYEPLIEEDKSKKERK